MSSSEQELISRLIERLPEPAAGTRVGSGDDAAVVEDRGRASVTTIDAIVEGVHFTLPEFPLEAVGRKALAASLSDLAAMGAEAGEGYVALGAPERLDADRLLAIGDGLAAVAEREGVAVLGGDVTRAPALFVSVACVGYEPEGTDLVGRAGARPGDVVAVTGSLGGAPAALRLLTAGAVSDATRAEDRTRAELLARQLDPRPRLAEGRALAGAGARGMIDISDGLGIDAGNLARAGGVSISLQLEDVPLAAGTVELCGSPDAARELALGGGEEFELLVCLPPDRLDEAAEAVARAGSQLTMIGRVSEGEAGAVTDGAGRRIEGSGFDHMRGSRAGSR